jgi:hypothetical protein
LAESNTIEVTVKTPHARPVEEAERELDAGQAVSEEELWARLQAIP